jgi:hypothetical protein
MIICDKCFTKHPPQKVTKYKNEYLCDKCLGERLSDKYDGKTGRERVGLSKWSRRRGGGIIQLIKALFKR